MRKVVDAQHGPVFVARIFHDNTHDRKLSLVAHHLCVDLVSWQIMLHDLDMLLNDETLLDQTATQYWKWSQSQHERAQKFLARDVLPMDIPLPRIDYWRVGNQSNTFADMLEASSSLSIELTKRLLHSRKKGLRMELVDLYVGVAIYSVSQVFTDREPPTFWCENHGREGTDEFDVSGTIG